MKQKIEFPNPVSILKSASIETAVRLAELYFGRKQQTETEIEFLKRILDSTPMEKQLFGPFDALMVNRQDECDIIGMDDVFIDREFIDEEEVNVTFFIKWVVYLHSCDDDKKTLWRYSQITFILTQALGSDNQHFLETCREIDKDYEQGYITCTERVLKKIRVYKFEDSPLRENVMKFAKTICDIHDYALVIKSLMGENPDSKSKTIMP